MVYRLDCLICFLLICCLPFVLKMATSLIAKRRVRTTNINSVRRVVEKALSCIEKFDVAENTIEDLTSFRDTLVEKFNKIQHLNEEISYLIEDESELQQDDDSATDFTLTYRRNIAIINKFLDKQNKTDDNNTSIISSRNNTVKLPALKIHAFDGKPENWQTFYENFQCAVDNNEDLNAVQKMTYLRNLLQGQALSTITGLSLTNSNYNVALNLLKERYDNKQLLISYHMKSLLSLERVTNLKNIDSLRRVYDNLEIQIRSLENLGIDSSMYGPLLIPVLMQKIPDELNLIIT